ncbi:unnamed protein product, partial [Effrenium voratum]
FEITHSGSWPALVRPVLEKVDPWYAILFLPYIALVVFAVIRVVTALFIKETLASAANDAEMVMDETRRLAVEYQEKLEELFCLVDDDGDGHLSAEEFLAAMSLPSVEQYLRFLDVSIRDCRPLFDILTEGDGLITITEFCKGLMQLKGQARALDIVVLQHENSKLMSDPGFDRNKNESALGKGSVGRFTIACSTLPNDFRLRRDTETERTVRTNPGVNSGQGGTPQVSRFRLAALAMPPKKVEEPPPPEPQEEQEEPKRKAWVYGINNHVDRLDAGIVQAFRGTGHPREDFATLCRQLNLPGHHELMPTKVENTEEAPEAEAEEDAGPPKVLALQSCLLDHASMLMLKVVIPFALRLEVLRVSGCGLDLAQLALLRQSLQDSTVQTLHLEWNRTELGLSDAQKAAVKEAHHWSEIDEAEKALEERRAQRALSAFREELEFRQGGSLGEAIQQLSEKVVPGHKATAKLWPMDLQTWISVFYDAFHMDVLDCEPIFNILDSDLHGDGLVPLEKLQEVLEALPVESDSADDRLMPPLQPVECLDDIGSAFGAFLDTSLEMVSFRCCNLSRLEIQALSFSLSSAPHLRALNLWGNKICDRSVKHLAEALEFNWGLQFLGLGRNFVTHQGLRSLCRVLGRTHITDKATADKVIKGLKDQQKELEKKKKSQGAPPKDGNGRERYFPEIRFETCEEVKAESGTYWLWTRNVVLKTLNLEENPISDVDAVEALQPLGSGALVLRATPCALPLLERERQRAKEEPPEEGQAAKPSGWRLVLV